MGYTRTTAGVYGQALALAATLLHHIAAEDQYSLDPGPQAFAKVRTSAESVVATLLDAFNPLDAGGRRILAEAAARAAQIEDELGAAAEGF